MSLFFLPHTHTLENYPSPWKKKERSGFFLSFAGLFLRISGIVPSPFWEWGGGGRGKMKTIKMSLEKKQNKNRCILKKQKKKGA